MDRSTGLVPLGRLCLTKQEVAEALEAAGHLVDRNSGEEFCNPPTVVPQADVDLSSVVFLAFESVSAGLYLSIP